MDSSSQDKNLPATPQRLKKARDDGQVARSKDLSNLVVLGGGMLVLAGLAPTGFARMRDSLAGQLRFDNASVRAPELMLQRLSDNAAQALIAAGSVALSTKPIEPKLSNISPLSGFKRLFSRQQVIETFKLVGITAVVLLVAGQFIVNHAEAFATLLMRPLEAGIGQLAQWLAVGVGLLLLVIGVVAAIDLPTQRFLHKHRLRMSHAEIDQEIPGALYTAVAQVRAWVYQFKSAMNGQGRMPADPQPTVPPELDPHFKKKPQEAEQ